MPFRRVDLLESRLDFVRRVLSDGSSVSSACREFGICRTTGRKWLARYAEEQVCGLEDRSRRPGSSPSQTPDAVVERILALKAEHPAWGGRKLSVLLGEGAPCARTVDRILKSRGLAAPAPAVRSVGRFARADCNELWQMDFKGVPKGAPQVLGCVDDASRFCILLSESPSQRLEDFWPLLWEAFGEFGLPEAVLTDNGASFRNNASKRFSSFDIRLLLLGVKPLHGRPFHPQTQGKVERFFGTLEREKGLGRESEFRSIYNHKRPHEAIAMKTPAQVYQRSTRRRPEAMPSPLDFPDASHTRRTDEKGCFSWNGQRYKLGRALADTTIAVKEDRVYCGQASIGELRDYKLHTMSCLKVDTMS